MSADFIFMNGDIHTLDEKDARYNSLSIQNGKIKRLGTYEQTKVDQGKNTEVIDLQGKTLFPGFIESHTHPFIFGMSLLEFDCRATAVSSIKEMLEKLAVYHRENQSDLWIRGRGWDDSKLAEKRAPTRWDLDEVVPDRPVVLYRTCAHVCVLNSEALRLLEIDKHSPDPEGGKIVREGSSQEPNGILEERARELVPQAEYSMEDAEKGMKLGQEKFAEWGITTAHEAGVWSQFQFQVYQHMYRTNQLNTRFRLWFWGIPEPSRYGFLDSMINLGVESGFGSDLLQVAGSKFMLDGAVGGKTAALAEPYENETTRGILHHDDPTKVKEAFQRSLENGLRVAVHAIGEQAIEIALDCFESAHQSQDIRPMRNRIEHVALPTKDHLERMKNLNLIAASSVGFIYHIGDSYLKNLGQQRANRVFPHRSFLDHGLVAPGNSDLPVTSANPLEGIYGLVNRKTLTGQSLGDEEKITVREALEAYTRDAAYSSCEEDFLGVIKEGLPADVVVLSENPLQVNPESIKDIAVNLTMMNGKIVYQK